MKRSNSSFNPDFSFCPDVHSEALDNEKKFISYTLVDQLLDEATAKHVTSLFSSTNLNYPLLSLEEPANKKARIDTVNEINSSINFTEVQLSKPLLKAIAHLGFEKPTLIQKDCIPIILKGKDVCACASTGTGKTAAFLLPILERLLYKPQGKLQTRVLVIEPTRDLANQVFKVAVSLSTFTKIKIALAIGGLDLHKQEKSVKSLPDVLIATPGRLIDMLRKTGKFNLKNVEVLVIDEADRLLDEYFQDQIEQIIGQLPFLRQTLLFSATMSSKVEDLRAVTLKNPVNLYINSNDEVAENLQQEFIKIRPHRENDRTAIVTAYLLQRKSAQAIVFVQTKKSVHSFFLSLRILGFSVGQLHGDMEQSNRISTLEKFKDNEISVLIATDVAARGLDISGIDFIVNLNMPSTYKQYIHRVGRTARAGRSGHALSLVGEHERKLFKEIVKNSSTSISRSKISNESLVSDCKEALLQIECTVDAIAKRTENAHLCSREAAARISKKRHTEESKKS